MAAVQHKTRSNRKKKSQSYPLTENYLSGKCLVILCIYHSKPKSSFVRMLESSPFNIKEHKVIQEHLANISFHLIEDTRSWKSRSFSCILISQLSYITEHGVKSIPNHLQHIGTGKKEKKNT